MDELQIGAVLYETTLNGRGLTSNFNQSIYATEMFIGQAGVVMYVDSSSQLKSPVMQVRPNRQTSGEPQKVSSNML